MSKWIAVPDTFITIDLNKCTGCGNCVVICGGAVLDFSLMEGEYSGIFFFKKGEVSWSLKRKSLTLFLRKPQNILPSELVLLNNLPIPSAFPQHSTSKSHRETAFWTPHFPRKGHCHHWEIKMGSGFGN